MNRSRLRLSRPAVVVGCALGTVLLLNGVALAYRLGSVAPSGTGTATASGNQLTFTLTGASVAALYPGGPAGPVAVNVTNPFSRPVTVTSTGLTVTTGNAGCTGSSFDTTSTVPASLAAGSATYTASVSLKSSAANECQGAAITLTVVINGTLS